MWDGECIGLDDYLFILNKHNEGATPDNIVCVQFRFVWIAVVGYGVSGTQGAPFLVHARNAPRT